LISRKRIFYPLNTKRRIMSEKQENWIIVIGGLIFLVFMYWINPWLPLLLPVAIFVAIMIEEHSLRKKRAIDSELKLKEANERIDFLQDELSDSKSCNRSLRQLLREREMEIQKLTRDPAAEMKQIELNAEKEITGGA
jgi:hypothetical protein